MPFAMPPLQASVALTHQFLAANDQGQMIRHMRARDELVVVTERKHFSYGVGVAMG